MRSVKWGYLRETSEKAIKAGKDADTGLHRTGLEEYLKAIFPTVRDWVHDKAIGKSLDGKKLKCRPDYRSEKLMLIVEFDGVQHYTNPDKIRRDDRNTDAYRRLGYKVVRIPYFIQLTNSAIKKFFGVAVKEPMFDVRYASLGVSSRNSPAYLCHAGLERMAEVFAQFPDQYKVNMKALKKSTDDFMTGASLLEAAYKRCFRKR